MGVEHRLVELRQLSGRTIGGVAIPWLQETRIGRLREVFEEGSATGVNPALLNLRHDPTKPLGVVEWRTTEQGLEFESELPSGAIQDGVLRDVREGRLRHASVEFSALKEVFEAELRRIREAVAVGVGLTNQPAYSQTTVEARERLLAASEGRFRVWL